MQRRSWGQAATPSRRVRCGRCQGWARLRLRGPSGSPEPEEKALAQGPTADSWPLLPDRPRATLEGLLASLMHSVSPEAPQPRFPLSLQAPVPLLPPPRSPPAPAQIEHGAPKAPASPSSWPCLSLSCDFFLLSTKQGLSPSEVTRLREHARLHSPSGEAPGLQSPLRPPGGLPRHRLTGWEHSQTSSGSRHFPSSLVMTSTGLAPLQKASGLTPGPQPQALCLSLRRTNFSPPGLGTL